MVKDEAQAPRAVAVRVADDTLSAELSDGRSISVPLSWCPAVAAAKSTARDNWRLSANGEAVFWPDLRTEVSVQDLLIGRALIGQSKDFSAAPDAVKLGTANPWWSNAAYVGALTGFLAAIIAAIGPLTAFVNGRYQLMLESQNQANELRIRHLDRAIDPRQTLEYRRRVLDFLIETSSPGEPMRVWAEKQLRTTEDLFVLRKELRGIERRRRELITQRNVTQEPNALKELSSEIDQIGLQINSIYERIAELDPSFVGESNVGGFVRLGERAVRATVYQEFQEGDDNAEDFYRAEYRITSGDCYYADEDAFSCEASISRYVSTITVRGENLQGKTMFVDLYEYDVAGTELEGESLNCVPVRGSCSVEYKMKSAP